MPQPVLRPLRVQVAAAAHGALLYDRTWRWPVAGAAPEGVAALVQASRQLGGEIDAGDLQRLVLEAAPAAAWGTGHADGGDGGGGGGDSGADVVEAQLVASGPLLGTLFHEVGGGGGGYVDGGADDGAYHAVAGAPVSEAAQTAAARRLLDLVLLAFANRYPAVTAALADAAAAGSGGRGAGSTKAVAAAARADVIGPDAPALDALIDELKAAVTGQERPPAPPELSARAAQPPHAAVAGE